MPHKKSGSPEQESGFCLGGREAGPGKCPSELREFCRRSGVSPTLGLHSVSADLEGRRESCRKERNFGSVEDCQFCFTSSGIFQAVTPHCNSKR